MRRILLSASLSILLAAPLGAQSGAAILGGLGGVFSGLAEDQRINALKEERARATARDAALYAEQMRAMRAISEERNRTMAETALRDSLAFALYLPRALMVLGAASDSLSLQGEVRKSFRKEGSNTLVNLYAVDHTAANAQMREALSPIVKSYADNDQLFLKRASWTLNAIADSLHLGKTARGLFFKAVIDSVNAVRSRTLLPDEPTMRAAVAPGTANFLLSRRVNAIRRKSPNAAAAR